MRSILENKAGKTSAWMIFGGIGIFLLLGFLVYNQTTQSVVIDGREDTPSGCADSTGILTVNAVSKLDGASDPSSPTITCGTDGDKVKTSVTSGTTTFPVGAMLTCLVSKSDYIDTSFTSKMACGGLNQQVEMYYATSDNPSLTVKDPNNGDTAVTDAIGGGATNLTNPSAGSTVDFDVQFKGTNTEGTGDLIYVIEFPAGSSSNITAVTMGGLSQVEVPDAYTIQNAGSEVVAFAVPNIEGATKQTYSVIATLGTSSDLTGGVYTDWFAKQEFIDDDGYIKEGVEDSDNTAKYENTDDSDFYID